MKLLLSTLLFLISAVSSDGRSLPSPSPDDIENCDIDYVTDVDTCSAHNATAVGYYKYVDYTKHEGTQYFVCAYNYTGTAYSSGSILTGERIEADSICKINEVQIPLPEDSNATCSDLSTSDGIPFNISSDCFDRCTNVIFKDWDIAYEFVQPSAITAINGKDTCLCVWDDNYSPIVGCRTDGSVIQGSYLEFTSSDANAFFKTSFAAVVAAAVAVSAASIEIAFL